MAIGFAPPFPTSAPLSSVLAVAEKATLGALGGLIENAPRGVSPTIMAALRGFHYVRLVRLDAPVCITSWGGDVAFVSLPPTTFAPRWPLRCGGINTAAIEPQTKKKGILAGIYFILPPSFGADFTIWLN